MIAIDILFTSFLMFILLMAFSYLGWWFSQSAFWRGRWSGEKEEVIPESAPRLALHMRALQAAMVTVLGLSVLYFLGAANADAPFNHLGEMHRTKAIIVGVVTAATAAMILFAALLALAGGVSWSCWLTALVLLAFGALTTYQSGTWSLLDELCPGDSAEPVTTYTFTVNDELPGVEIWVNQVCLGKTPLRITREEFLARVPVLTSIPGVTTTANVGPPGMVFIDDRTRTWNQFNLPEPTSYRAMSHFYHPSNQRSLPPQLINYFVRARLNGEWGKSTGCCGSSGSGGRYSHRCTVSLGFTFPTREAKINTLLNEARNAGVRLTPECFKALEALNPTAWRLLGEQAAKDQAMQPIRDAWTIWHYRLDQATTPDAVWQTMETIAREAETKKEFDTTSIAGRAVAMLAPRLDLTRLLDEAVRLLQKYRNANWNYGYGRRPGGMEFSGRITPDNAGNPIPVRAYVIAQAVRTAGEQLKAKNGHYPPEFQTRLAHELLQFARGNENFLAIAANYGGAEVEQFLMRLPWNAPPQINGSQDTTYIGGGFVNKWLKLLAGMDNDIGRRFRATHRQEVLDLAHQILVNSHAPWTCIDNLSFLFLDPQLVVEFWPVFKSSANVANSVADMQSKWKYLVKMEPATKLETYLETWREDMASKLFPFAYTILNELDGLPAQRRKEVLTAIQQEFEKTFPPAPANRRNRDPRLIQQEEIRENIQRRLKEL